MRTAAAKTLKKKKKKMMMMTRLPTKGKEEVAFGN